jgi:hypothetical protein
MISTSYYKMVLVHFAEETCALDVYSYAGCAVEKYATDV